MHLAPCEHFPFVGLPAEYNSPAPGGTPERRSEPMQLTQAVVLSSALCLMGCNLAPVSNPIVTTSQFDASEVAYIHDHGANTIKGQAFLRQRNGNVVTCAGHVVLLIPIGTYSAERFGNLYGTTTRAAQGIARLDEADPDYARYTRETICNAQGDFQFDNVADGRYFIATRVLWETVGYGGTLLLQGGPVMTPVHAKDGNIVQIIIAP